MRRTEIYLLEDMQDDVYIIRHMLGGEKSTQYKVVSFATIEELEIGLSMYKPDGLLTDLNLPGSTGLDTLVKVKKMAPDVPIIVLTSGDEEVLGDRAIQFGAQDFIPKSELTPNLLRRSFRFAKERHVMTRSLENLVSIDELTLVYNRKYFDERVQLEIDEADRYKRKFGLLILDLDKFKPINDKYGHKAGDRVLRYVGNRLKDINRSADIVARYGEDEFVVIIHGLHCSENLNSVVKNHLAKFNEKYFLEVDGEIASIDLSVSVGGAIYPDDATDSEVLLNVANRAMYENKSRKKQLR